MSLLVFSKPGCLGSRFDDYNVNILGVISVNSEHDMVFMFKTVFVTLAN